jgi:hypothetical protein
MVPNRSTCAQSCQQPAPPGRDPAKQRQVVFNNERRFFPAGREEEPVANVIHDLGKSVRPFSAISGGHCPYQQTSLQTNECTQACLIQPSTEGSIYAPTLNVLQTNGMQAKSVSDLPIRTLFLPAFLIASPDGVFRMFKEVVPQVNEV